MNRTVLIGLGMLAAVGVLGLMAVKSIKTPALPAMPTPEPEKPSGLLGEGSVFSQPGEAPTAAKIFSTSPILVSTLQNPAIPQWGKDRIMRIAFGRQV